MNAVIYARYSSDKQREESIEGQLRECKEYADQNAPLWCGPTLTGHCPPRPTAARSSSRSHTGTVHCYYKCGTRKRSGKEACSLKPVRKEPLEQFVVKTALEKVRGENFEVLCETIKKTAFKVTRVGQLVAQEASRMLNVPFGIVDLSLAPTRPSATA